MKLLLLIIINISVFINVQAQNFVHEKFRSNSINLNGKKSNELIRMSSLSEKIKKQHSSFLKELNRTSKSVREYFNIDYLCNQNNKDINFDLNHTEFKTKKFHIRHNIINNTFEFFPSYALKITSKSQNNIESDIRYIIRRSCKNELNSNLWIVGSNLRQLDTFLAQAKLFIEIGSGTYQDRLDYFIYNVEVRTDDIIIDENFKDIYSDLYDIYQKFNDNAANNNLPYYESFNEFIRKANKNKTTENLVTIVDRGNNYVNNAFSNFTKNEFEVYTDGRVRRGSNVNILNNVILIERMYSNRKLYFDSELFYYVTDENDLVINRYDSHIKLLLDSNFENIITSYKSDVINKYIDHVSKTSSKYVSRELDYERSSSTFLESVYNVCIDRVPISNLIEKEIHCRSIATKESRVYKNIDNRYLIPENKWYKFYVKSDEIYVENWGFLKDILIYDIYTKTFKISDLNNTSLTFESDFIDKLKLVDYSTLLNDYLNSQFEFDIKYQVSNNRYSLLSASWR